jgi:hypothetical protein
LLSGQGDIAGRTLKKITLGIDETIRAIELKLPCATVIAPARGVAQNEETIATP